MILMVYYSSNKKLHKKSMGVLTLETILLNDILKTPIKRIESGSELVLVHELDKYSREMLGKELKLGTVKINKDLFGSAEFSYVVHNGLDTGLDVAKEDLVNYKGTDFFLRTVEGVHLNLETPEKVEYEYDSDTAANSFMHGDNRSRAYVSLVANFMVKAYKDGLDDYPNFVFNSPTYSIVSKEYSDLYILSEYGNRILKDKVELLNSASHKATPYESFVTYKRQLGYMNRPYLAGEKFKYLKKNFELGDVVVLYSLKKGAQGIQFRELSSAYPAVITAMDETKISLTYYPTVETRLTRAVKLSDAEDILQDEGKPGIYTEDDVDAFFESVETYPLTSIGIDNMTFNEDVFFIVPGRFDGSYQYVRTQYGQSYVHMDTIETIYAVFEDRKVRYNKERFLEMYFKDETPLFDKYRDINNAEGVIQ